MMVIGSCELLDFSHFGNYILMNYAGYSDASYHLQQLSGGQSQYPEIIIGSYDEENADQAASFGLFLNSHEHLAAIPFILVEHRDRPISRSGCKPMTGINDIVRDNISAEELFKKVTLLRKFQSLRQRQLKLIKLQQYEVPSDRRPLYKIDSLFKRFIDILISSVALAVLSPVLVLIALIIKLDSKGTVFYTSYRAGSNYRIFKFIKFRTMVAEADDKLSNLKNLNQYASADRNAPVFFKISNDPRITRFGKFLRNTSLDELPQLFNVLKGDMSLVGNRPLPLYEAKTLTTDRLAERFNAPAGITGLWQISKRGQKEMSVDERIALDIDYARHNSLVQDWQIILKTPKALFQKDNV